MEIVRLIDYLEKSFLAPLLLNDDITDISYNGEDIYYLDNNYGRRKSEIKISYQTAKDFLRQVANLAEKQFSFQKPELDISFGRYRLNALHQSVCRKNNAESVCFSLRLTTANLRINQNAQTFGQEIMDLLDVLVHSQVSLVIGGLTGSGKTELQKYLLTRMRANSRVIVIDNVLELDQMNLQNQLDLNVWQVDENRQQSSIQQLVKTALRSNPDWLIVAESRGAEMLDVLNSALTGHPIITTIHAFDITSMPERMTRMVMMNSQTTQLNEVYQDIVYHLRFYIYLKRQYSTDGLVKRYISSIAYLNKESMEEIYGSDGLNHCYGKLSDEALKSLDISKASPLFRQTFLRGQK
ncbi:MAG: type II/IV secretion system ATPase subunit [Erysipelotrichaceae bacterium]|jgi:pilus assembly protein CpaF|nr:type II/IV secretion system ATPase subunit [Erysipelotrichaceae bacterium]